MDTTNEQVVRRAVGGLGDFEILIVDTLREGFKAYAGHLASETTVDNFVQAATQRVMEELGRADDAMLRKVFEV